jgi:hypothetical protein
MASEIFNCEISKIIDMFFNAKVEGESESKESSNQKEKGANGDD